jgi:hypothetical protein
MRERTAGALSLGAVVIFALRWIFDLPGRFLDTWGVEQTGALLWHDPALINDHVAASVFGQDTVTLSTWLTYVVVYRFGFSAESFFIAMSILQVAIAAVSLHVIGARVAGSPYGGAFAVAIYFLAPASLLAHASIGYALNFGAGYFPGMFAMALGLAAIALWLSERTLATAIFLGLLADYHPTAAAVIGLAFVLDLLTQPPRHAGRILAYLAIMAILATPAAIEAVALLGRARPAIDWDAWWAWADLRKGFHITPWRDPSLMGPLMVLIAIYGGCLYLAARERLLSAAMAQRLMLLLTTALGLFAVQYVLVELVRWPTAAALFLSRLTTFLPPVAAALAFAVLAAQMRKHGPAALAVVAPVALLLFMRDAGRSDEALLTALFLGALFFLTRWGPKGWLGWAVILPLPIWALLRYALSPNGFPQLRVGPLARIGLYIDMDWFASYLAAVAIGIAMILAARAAARQRPWVPLVVGLAALGLVNDVWLFQPDSAGPRAAAVYELGDWARAGTSPGSVMVTRPEFPCADFCLGRLTLLSWAAMGVSDYAPRAFPAESAALRIEYDFDLHDRAAIAALRLDLPGGLARRFSAMSDAEAAKLQEAVPSARFLVAERASQGAGPFLPDLRFPIVHENAWYRVYDLAGARK